MIMTEDFEIVSGSSSERLNTLANLVELALYAPEGEVTIEGRAAIQRAAREVVLLSRTALEFHGNG